MCGQDKRKGHSFCYWCYRLLSPELQQGLYLRIGEGHEEAYDEAVLFLEREGRI